MADATLAAFTAAYAQNYRGDLVRTFNARSTLLKALRLVPGEGKNCAFGMETTGAIGENFAEGADVSSTGSNAMVPATLNWGLYRSSWLITDLAVAASASTRTPLGIQQLNARQMVNSANKLAKTINALLFSGTDSTDGIVGLDVALHESNTYAGLDRSQGAYANFRSHVYDLASAAPTFKYLREKQGAIYDSCGEMPDLAICPTAVWQKIASLFDEQRRYNQPIMEMQTARGVVKLDASAGALELDGCVYIKDADATAASVYFLNTNHVHIEYLPLLDPGLGAPSMQGAALSDGYGAIPLGMGIYPLARAGAAQKYTMEVQMQLVVTKPLACGLITNVLTT
jgi:hypothetical protein